MCLCVGVGRGGGGWGRMLTCIIACNSLFTGRWASNLEGGPFLPPTTLHQFFASFHPMLSRVSCAPPVCLKENGKGLLRGYFCTQKCHVLLKENNF